jgi:hypothetical protein
MLCGASARAATLRVRVEPERWRDVAAVPAYPARPADAAVGAARAAPLPTAAGVIAADDRVVIPILLGPDARCRAVRAPWPVIDLGTGWYHGFGIAHVACRRADLGTAPFELEIETEPAPGAVRPRRPGALATLVARRTVETLVANPTELAAYAEPTLAGAAPAPTAFKPSESPSLEGSAVQMLILTRDALVPAFQVYADARTGLGIPTAVRSVEWVRDNYPQGADLPETLRDFLREAYRLWGVRAVIIGGDTELVPTRYASSVYSFEGEVVPTDQYYACLDGDWNADGDAHWGEGFLYSDLSTDMADLYPELYIGRLPVTTAADVQVALAKLRAYSEPAVQDYQHKVTFLAEVLWPANYVNGGQILKNGADNAERIIIQNALTTGGYTLTRLYETPQWYPGSTRLSRTAGLAAMDAGQAMVVHIGHGFRYAMSLGDISANNPHALGLVNGTRPFFLNMLNCSAAAFDFPCLAEKFLQNPNGGAVGVIGATREAYPDNVQLFQEAWFREQYNEGVRGAAAALDEARLRYVPQCFDDNAYRWSYFITTYLGDPELELWTAAPLQAQVTHPATLIAGAQSFTVRVLSGGAPVVGATVCAWKAGDCYAVERTGATGAAGFVFAIESPGALQLTVSGAGVLPYRTTVPVQTPLGASVRATGACTIVDTGPGTSGNGNGVAEAGETVQLRLEVENVGQLVADDVTLQAFCSDPAVVLPSAITTVGDIAAGARVVASPLTVTVAHHVPDQQRLRLDLVLRTAQSWAWSDRLDLDLLQVSPQVLRLVVEDGSTGNGDGRPQANEIYDLRVELKNYGFAHFDGGNAHLLALDPDVVVLDGTATFGAAPHLGTTVGRFRVRETSVAQPNAMLAVLVDGRGRSWNFRIETRRPAPPTNVVGDPSAAAGTATLTWSPSPSADVAGYVVYRAAASFGPYVRAGADRIDSATYFRDDGLAGGTRFYYTVAAVDSAGNESARTTPREVTTTPAALPGWPRTLGVPSNSSPVVADVNGDNQLELFVGGSGNLYAWHPNGTELRNGDANAATDGVFTPVAANFMPALAAGDLDGNGDDEIVGCTFDTREVYVFEGNGSVRSGWPRPILSALVGVWAAPVLADLDLDGRLEVIVLALDGRLYAWRADGSEVRDGDADPTTQGVFFRIPGNGNWSRGAPVVANILAADATPEIVFGTENWMLYMLRANGSVAPGWPRTFTERFNAAPAIGDIDADGSLDIAVPCRDGFLYALRADATNLSGWPRPLENFWNALTPSVALADFDRDGKLDLVVPSTGHTSDQGKLWVFDWQGNVRPGWPVDVRTSAETSPVVGDLNGDGMPEIVYGGESATLYALTANGATLPGFPIRLGAEARATPCITDLDSDGRVDLVLPGWDQQVYVWEFAGGYVRANTPWGSFKNNALRNGLYQYRNPTDTLGPVAPPARSALFANVPNPFNPATTLRFDVGGEGAQRVRLHIFDVRGQRVRVLLDRAYAPGHYAERWDGRDDGGRPVASGVYFYRLETADLRAQRKMVLVR